MLGIGDKSHDHGADTQARGGEDAGKNTDKLSAPLQIPKLNRSTGNLALLSTDKSEKARMRMSFDAGAAAAEYDHLARSPIMTDHNNGLGLSGLRRIRQSQPSRSNTMGPSNANSRSPSISLSRSTSMTMLQSLASGPSSPVFTEDLSRFPSESLHSFSFAHQSEDYIHNRQNVLKRSIEYMKDRIGRSAASNPALASVQARVSGDFEQQQMLDLLAKAQLMGIGDPSHPHGPLTGPADMSAANVFEKNFIPRTESPELLEAPSASPMADRLPEPIAPAKEEGKGKSTEKIDASRPPFLSAATQGDSSENSSRTPTNESGTTQKTSPSQSRPGSLKRTFTDTVHASMQQKLMDAIAQPFVAGQPGYAESVVSPTGRQSFSSSMNAPSSLGSSVHGHSSRWVPAAQAIFTTEAKPPWTILAANDLACLVFGVTKAEVRKMGILEVVQQERRDWLEDKLKHGEFESDAGTESETEASQSITKAPARSSVSSNLLGPRGGGITARLLSKPNSRSQTPKMTPVKRPETFHSGDWRPPRVSGGGHSNHKSNKSRGVLLCGDVVPIQKRNGATGSASIWVKEKRVGLIWVVEEIHEDVAYVSLDEEGIVTKITGELASIWGDEDLQPGMDVGKLIPRIPRQGIDPRYGAIDYAQIAKRRYYTCRNCDRINIPATVQQVRGQTELRISSFPHIAGIVVVDPGSLTIKSSNSVFCGALFGHERPDGMPINSLLPNFDKVLRILTEEDGVHLVDGIVVPEHSFRKASAFLGLREGRPDAASTFLRPEGLPAKHRDGTDLKIDVQMRVVKSEKQTMLHEETLVETSDEESAVAEDHFPITQTEMVFALWITYSRHIHATRSNLGAASPLLSGTATPLRQPSPGQASAPVPADMTLSDSDEPKKEPRPSSMFSKSIKEAALSAAAKLTGSRASEKAQIDSKQDKSPVSKIEEPAKKSIEDFVILEEMGQGAYGQVKLARYKPTGKKIVLKYVTKKRILVDTWTRDRKLGTVPLEIHVLSFLRREDLRHPNIVEMEDFFEDDVNYYIEMVPHGLPGMDLFDYIELRSNMEEHECRSIFIQVARAIHHLHIKAKVVHRDIKDENVVLDGEGIIKLIDFGSAAYVKSGPFDVFVGTIDYAAPEVLAGNPYNGKEQDVWALGILLYTIIYKENPFYSIDEIMDRDLRVPYTISDESIDLIRCMLNRDVEQRYDINQVLEHPWCNMDDNDGDA
ncbi:Serine/threonine-protein kinase PSK2 [Cytospora mali]|uniref:non-specific serine/threonine protein kinase n=1 Tax=Cytospora mali TaxID=578113 RepID=A0A194V6G4_CYTMA|nr:Serine/threonine-protein kinase PSK2 [Valsa mali var. pyri (nom. inval.)]